MNSSFVPAICSVAPWMLYNMLLYVVTVYIVQHFGCGRMIAKTK
jgi:hypothetical protein